jgi:cytoskeletal protein CcmA (bactofilin family)
MSALATVGSLARNEFDTANDHASLTPSLPAVPSPDTHTSVIAPTTAWTGNLESSGSLHIHGRVEGSLMARDDVFIADEAEVEATINAANVTVAGKVRGSIQCAERFEILPHGRVAGDVRAPVIVIHEGALIAGEISMISPGSDTKTAAPAPRAVRHRA